VGTTPRYENYGSAFMVSKGYSLLISCIQCFIENKKPRSKTRAIMRAFVSTNTVILIRAKKIAGGERKNLRAKRLGALNG